MARAPPPGPAGLRPARCTSDPLGGEGPGIAHQFSEKMCGEFLAGYFFSLDRDYLICETELLLDLFKHGGEFLVRTDQPSVVKVLCRVCEADSPLILTVP